MNKPGSTGLVAPLLVAPLLVALMMGALFAAPAWAAVPCTNDSQCPGRTVCIDQQCVLDGGIDAAAKPDESADRECGSDRRCRIRRLARRNRARRMTQTLFEQERLQSLIERREQQQKERVRREADPVTLDMRISAINEFGVMGGYAITPHFKAEASAHFPFHPTYTSVQDRQVNGDHDFALLSVGPTYYFSDSTYSWYAKGTFSYGTGSFRVFSDNSWLDTVQHLVSLGGGFDMQFELGLHLRVGLMYRLLLFTQATYEPGQYHDDVEKALEQEFEDIDGIVSIGWAF